ncbi:hypothetical protein [Micromonospora sp. NBC_00421]|uniref:hypothetical protein n=1 Tax=Micromonospora sp. NBC_00421 TaxID=2975976 RepID=UPI002E1CF540
MASVVVRRGNDLGGLLRRMKIELDGVVVARLKQGESITLKVNPGPHVFRARLDWLTSAPLELHVEENMQFTLAVAAGEKVQTYDATFIRPETALELLIVEPGNR